MTNRIEAPTAPPLAWPVLLTLIGIRVVLWFWLGDRYGYHGDEFYYIESTRHLDYGYVDHPPFVVWAAYLAQLVLGESLHALRFPSMAAGVVTIALTVLVVRQFGGGVLAQFLGGFCVLFAPVYLVIGNMLDIPVFEQVAWTLAAYLIVLSVRRDAPRLWVLVGVTAGVGLLIKHTMVLWGVGIAAGLLFTERRSVLRTPWPWAGALVALAVFSPNLVWQARNGWPTLEFIRSMEGGPLAEIPRVLFVLGQVLYQGPFFAFIWILGLVFFFTRHGKPYRLFGWLYVVVFAIVLARQGKPYYLAACYPVLFAGGAVWLEAWLREPRLRWIRRTVVFTTVVGGIALAPLAAPVFPLPQTEAGIAVVVGGVVEPQAVTGDARAQIGWAEQLDQLAEMAKRGREMEVLGEDYIFLSNRYSLTGAVQVVDTQNRLAPAFSGHMSWYYWGPPPESASSALVHGYAPDLLEHVFVHVNQIGTLVHPMGEGIEYLRPAPIYACTGLRTPWADVWPRFRKFNHDD